MNTLTQPDDNPADPQPPPGVTPYFLRCAVLREAVRDEIARRRRLAA